MDLVFLVGRTASGGSSCGMLGGGSGLKLDVIEVDDGSGKEKKRGFNKMGDKINSWV